MSDQSVEFIITLKVKMDPEGEDGFLHPVDWNWNTIFNSACGGSYQAEVLNISPMRMEGPNVEEIFDTDPEESLRGWSEQRYG